MNYEVTFCKSDRVYFYTKSLLSPQKLISENKFAIQNHFCEITLAQSSPIHPETGMSASLPAVENLIAKIKSELLNQALDLDPYLKKFDTKDLQKRISAFNKSESSLLTFNFSTLAKELALIQFIQDKALNEKLPLHRIDITNTAEKFSIQYFPHNPENSIFKISLPLKIESSEILSFPVESIQFTFHLDTLIDTLKSKTLYLDYPGPITLENQDLQNSQLKEIDFFKRIRDKININPSPLQTEFILADQTTVKII